MKLYLTSLLLALTISLFGQAVDSLGIDNNPRLNKYEAAYFNNIFKDRRENFDFVGKKVAFITGSTANRHWSKTEYFSEIKPRQFTESSGSFQFPIFLTEEEKIKSGGYDVILLSWVKLLTDRRRKQIISELQS